MDTRLIFRDFCSVRWEDGVQYVERIIGFTFGSSGKLLGKSGSKAARPLPSEAKTLRATKGNLTKRASKKIL